MNLLVVFLLILLFAVVAPSIGLDLGASLSYLLIAYCLALIIPQVSIQIRRLRDAGLTPWWILIGFLPWIGALALLILLCLPSRL